MIIKFRAYYKTEKRFHYFTLSDYANNHDMRNKIQNEPKQQFTGLKDKNSKEIFEGDILSYGKENRGEVKMSNFCWRVFWNIKDPKGESILDETLLGYYEIIGNIFENKDLLG